MSIRKDSFFDTLKLPLKKIISVLYLHNIGVLNNVIAEILAVNRETVGQILMFLREEMSKNLITRNIVLGGPNCVVEVDECCISKAKTTRNNRARPRAQKWIVGAYDRNTGIVIFRRIENKTKETLQGFLYEVCLPGTHIMSDGHRSYQGLNQIGFSHSVVIHEREFVTNDGVHINNIESKWSHCKRKFKYFYGTNEENLALHIDEFMWEQFFERKTIIRWIELVNMLRINYI